MDDLTLLATRTAVEKAALAMPPAPAAPASGEHPIDPVGVAQGVGSLGLLGGTANWARNTYNRIPPSILSLGESMWRDPEHVEQFRQRVKSLGGDQRGRAMGMIDALTGDRRQLRHVLTGGMLPEQPQSISDLARELTFGQVGTAARGAAHEPLPGDVVTWGPKGEVASPAGAATTALTGNSLNHVGIMGSGSHMLTVGVNDRLQAEPEVKSLANMRNRGQVMARFRDLALSPEQREAVRTVAPEVYGRQVPGRRGVPGPLPYDYARKSDLALRELLPELGTRSGRSLLSAPLDWASNNNAVSSRLKRMLPTDVYRQMISARKLQARCGPGEVCSTIAGRVLQGVGAPVAAEMSPGDVLRRARPGGRFRIAELNVPEALRNRRYLLGSHYQRLVPAAMRTPFIAAGLGLSALGLGAAARRLAPSFAAAPSPQVAPQAPPAAVPAAPAMPSLRQHNVAAVTDLAQRALRGWWGRMQQRYGGQS